VQVGLHSSGRLISDLNRGFQDSLWDDMRFTSGGWFSRDKDTIGLVAARTELLELFLQRAEPFGDQVNILHFETPFSKNDQEEYSWPTSSDLTQSVGDRPSEEVITIAANVAQCSSTKA